MHGFPINAMMFLQSNSKTTILASFGQTLSQANAYISISMTLDGNQFWHYKANAFDWK